MPWLPIICAAWLTLSLICALIAGPAMDSTHDPVGNLPDPFPVAGADLISKSHAATINEKAR